LRLLSLSVEPPALSLTGAGSRQQVLVTGKFSDGSERDLTRAATYIADRRSFAVSADGVVTPRADGATALTVKFWGQALRLPVTVAEADRHPPVRFVTDVVPMLTKVGCNSGACHGAAAGKNGFRLSLRGFDPALDYEQMAREKRGGRINKIDPEASLLLKKATATVPHGGGQPLRKASEEYRILARWMREGAPGVDADFTVTDVAVLPAERVMAR
jgi:hypothetical protein